eukprot:3738839-Prymnesium_polylepis.1
MSTIYRQVFVVLAVDCEQDVSRPDALTRESSGAGPSRGQRRSGRYEATMYSQPNDSTVKQMPSSPPLGKVHSKMGAAVVVEPGARADRRKRREELERLKQLLLCVRLIERVAALGLTLGLLALIDERLQQDLECVLAHLRRGLVARNALTDQVSEPGVRAKLVRTANAMVVRSEAIAEHCVEVDSVVAILLHLEAARPGEGELTTHRLEHGGEGAEAAMGGGATEGVALDLRPEETCCSKHIRHRRSHWQSDRSPDTP